MSPGAIVLAWNGEAPEVGKLVHLVAIRISAHENCLKHYFKSIVGYPVHFSASIARCYEARRKMLETTVTQVICNHENIEMQAASYIEHALTFYAYKRIQIQVL